MGKTILKRGKRLLLTVLTVFGFVAIASLQPAVAAESADYTVGGSGWNEWNSYWMNHPDGKANWNDGGGYNHDGMYMKKSYSKVQMGQGGSYGSGGYHDNTNYHPKIVHGLPPQVRSGQDIYNVQTGQMTGVRAYTQSVTPHAFKTTVCAEDYVNGYKYHLGCVPEAPYMSAADGPARFDFNVWPAQVGGNHTIKYTYRDAWGNWKPIQTPWSHNYGANISI